MSAVTLQGNNVQVDGTIKNVGDTVADFELVGVDLAARTVIVLDENNEVVHSELVPEITNEPDYAAALAAAGQ